MTREADSSSGPSRRYLYDDGPASHPVVEYKADRAEKAGGSAIPSFVLDVTWPRVAVFYHAASPLCVSFKEKFVHLARETRRRSERVPVSFHAVSCAVHEDVCAEYEVKAVPVVFAFDSGRIDPVLVKRTRDNSIEPEQLARELGIELGEGASEGEDGLENQMAAKEALGKSLISNSDREDRSDVAAAAALANQMLSTHSSLSEVFADAANAFVATLQLSTFEEFAKNKALPAKRAAVLREFLDLLHWSLPSQWKLHDLINDLRNDFVSASRSHEDMMKVLHRHRTPGETPEWSNSCDRFDRGDIDGGLDRREGFQGYTCGFWRLLHISSVGVAEQHVSVMGDRERVAPSFVATTVRDYVEAFYAGSCMRCGRAVIESVVECRYELCTGRMADVRADTPPMDPGWRDWAVWLWRVHNDARERGFSRSPWPSNENCGGCQGALGWDLDAVYAHLKHSYWPSGVHNPRIVVLKSRHGRLARLRARASGSWAGTGLLFFCLVIVWFYWLRFRVRQSGLHKKAYLQNGASETEKRTRRLRHRSRVGTRYKSRDGARSRQQPTFLDT